MFCGGTFGEGAGTGLFMHKTTSSVIGHSRLGIPAEMLYRLNTDGPVETHMIRKDMVTTELFYS